MNKTKGIILAACTAVSVGFLVAFACVLAFALPHFNNLSVERNGMLVKDAKVVGYRESTHFGKTYYSLQYIFDNDTKTGYTSDSYTDLQKVEAMREQSIAICYQMVDGKVQAIEDGYTGAPGTAAAAGCTYAFSIVGGVGLIATAVYAGIVLVSARRAKRA